MKLLTRFILTLSISVMLNLSAVHAGKKLPNNILGLWCFYSAGQKLNEKNYLRNDASAATPGTPCRKNGDTEWIVLDLDGSYRGQDYKCRAIRVTVIDHGIVIKGTPGANAVYGLDTACFRKGHAWREQTRIQVERWGSALTISQEPRDLAKGSVRQRTSSLDKKRALQALYAQKRALLCANPIDLSALQYLYRKDPRNFDRHKFKFIQRDKCTEVSVNAKVWFHPGDEIATRRVIMVTIPKRRNYSVFRGFLKLHGHTVWGLKHDWATVKTVPPPPPELKHE